MSWLIQDFRLGPGDLYHPPEEPDPRCRRCGADLDSTNADEDELIAAVDAARRPRQERNDEDEYDELGGTCRTCRGDERCLACGEWILGDDARLDPFGCVMCGAESRHGVEVR